MMPLSKYQSLLQQHSPLRTIPPIVRKSAGTAPEGILPPIAADGKTHVLFTSSSTPSSPVGAAATAAAAAAGAGATKSRKVRDESKQSTKAAVIDFAATKPLRRDVKAYFKNYIEMCDATD